MIPETSIAEAAAHRGASCGSHHRTPPLAAPCRDIPRTELARRGRNRSNARNAGSMTARRGRQPQRHERRHRPVRRHPQPRAPARSARDSAASLRLPPGQCDRAPPPESAPARRSASTPRPRQFRSTSGSAAHAARRHDTGAASRLLPCRKARPGRDRDRPTSSPIHYRNWRRRHT